MPTSTPSLSAYKCVWMLTTPVASCSDTHLACSHNVGGASANFFVLSLQFADCCLIACCIISQKSVPDCMHQSRYDLQKNIGSGLPSVFNIYYKHFAVSCFLIIKFYLCDFWPPRNCNVIIVINPAVHELWPLIMINN